jgi:hypothetical protein
MNYPPGTALCHNHQPDVVGPETCEACRAEQAVGATAAPVDDLALQIIAHGIERANNSEHPLTDEAALTIARRYAYHLDMAPAGQLEDIAAQAVAAWHAMYDVLPDGIRPSGHREHYASACAAAQAGDWLRAGAYASMALYGLMAGPRS